MKRLFFAIVLSLLLATCCFADDFDGYIVKIKENPIENLTSTSVFSGASLMSELDDSEFVEFVSDDIDAAEEINAEHMLLKVDNMETLQQLIDLGIVESYEENGYMHLFDYDATLNPNYSDQKWYLDAINADFAWSAGVFGDEVKIAVIDSGVYQHDDIKRNIIPGKNYVEGYAETYTEDNTNHGTSVASIIASECNDLATVGISFKAKIVPLKVTDNSSLSISLAIEAIYDAVDVYECDVINLSFGDTSYSAALYQAIMYAIDNDVIVVAAAGNWGDTGYVYPASYTEVVSVANANATSTGFSIKDTSQKNDMVDIAAPGTSIYAICNSGSVSPQNGTSFSCPMVAATAALAKSIDPDITQSEFEGLIKASANKAYITSSGQDTNAWGSGMLDIQAMIKQMNSGKNHFVSDKMIIDEEVVVYITNLDDSASLENGTVIIAEYNTDGYLEKTKSVPISLGANESEKISLTQYGFSSAAYVNVIFDHTPGDINGDGEVSLRDASAIMRRLAGSDVVVVEAALDVNGDGDVSLRDASAIMRYLAGYDIVLN